MLADLGITVRSVREVAQERRGLVVLSSVMSVAGGSLPPIIAAYRADRPGVEIHVREGVQATVLEDVRSGVADFGIGYVDELPDFTTGTRAAVARRSAPSSRRVTLWPASASVALAELRDYPIVALPTELRTRRTIDAAAATAGVSASPDDRRHADRHGAWRWSRPASASGIVPRGATRGPLPAAACAPCRSASRGWCAASA